jgi:TPR repeat protein
MIKSISKRDFKFIFDECNIREVPDFYEQIISDIKNGCINNIDRDTKIYLLGLYEYRKENFNKAIELFMKAPNDSRCIFMRAIRLHKENKLEESLELLLEAIHLGDDDAKMHLIRNKEMYNLFENNKSNYEKKKILAKNEMRRINTWALWQLFFNEHGCNDEFLSYFKRTADKQHLGSYYHLAVIYEIVAGSIKADIKKAIEHFQVGAEKSHFVHN